MSRYCQIKTIFKDESSLVAALMETGNWNLEQIQVYDTPKNLVGYEGRARKEKANIIIQKKFVGRAANDIGFLRNEDGSFEAIISEYDSRKYGQAWLKNLKANYAFHTVRIEQESMGRSVEREMLPGGRQRVTVQGYR